ncbi:S8 family serine peptidase, partial [Nannocystis pusilla]|uniref:S8 family serine peptidase n=1 Tax=Nannocystis pusilla TaxID=889268 RepID=UPI003BF44F30
MQDTGFVLKHQAFAGVQVIAARDFVQGDDVVADEAGDTPGQQHHGTGVLSLIVADDGEVFSGVAPGVAVILAKTERIDVEEPYEEDYYVAGLEWIEGMGADIFTASLGYSDWYEPQQLDGKTAVVSQAATVAVANGLIMFAAIGNGGPDPKTLDAPADVDGVIAVGATDFDGVVTPFSSRGPTADDRIKPDLVAPGQDVYMARSDSLVAYEASQGTSLSTPLVAGVAALLLEAYPELDPPGMLALLRATATQPDAPDNDLGWGFVDGLAAAGLRCTCVD